MTSNSTASQRQRILARLQRGPMTTLQARKELDILHPSARVMELKERGHKIITNWTTDSSGAGNHRVAQYVLLVGGDVK